MSKTLNALIIEDLEDDALLILRELKRSGFNVVWERVETADALRFSLLSRPWDIVLSDFNLPSFNASMALQIVKQANPNLPFIVLSGTIGEASAVELMRQGANDYLMKGNLARLAEVIRRELREAEIRLERQQSESELARTKERLQLAIAGSGIGLWDWEVQSGNLIFNERWAEIIGYTIEELNPINFETWWQNVHPGDFQKVTLALEQHFLKENETYECEFRMHHKLGGWVWISASGKVVEWNTDGKPLRMTGTHLDISSRKQSVEMLQKLNESLERRVSERTADLQMSENRLLEAQQIAHLGSWELDVPTRKNSWSIEVFRIFRLDPYSPEPNYEEMLKYFPINDRTKFLQLIDRSIQLGETFETDLQIIRADGSLGYMFIKAEAVWNADDVVKSLFGIVMDISDRKQTEFQLQQTNQELIRATRLKDEFLASMSHELRTPLNAILGMTEGLLEGVFGTVNDRQIKALETIGKSGNHLLTLINDILDVAKIESGQMTLDLSPISVQLLCKSSILYVTQQAQQKQIQMIERIQQNLPELVLDERRIRQVLINLLNNAVKFTNPGGSVTLEVTLSSRADYREGSILRFMVKDNGIGIAPENINKLFQPFIQIDSALNRKYEGTGLGLALVKRIVELHNGKVTVSSELGVGSCFTVDIPCEDVVLVEQHFEQHVVQINPESPLQPNPSTSLALPLILLAEDNDANIITISSYLEGKGYRILVAKNGEEAIALTKTHQPDLVLMDIQMPIMDGIQAIAQIRHDPSLVDLPIIALTALAMGCDRDRCLEAGANEYLSKPVKLKQLANTIHQLLTY